MPHDGSKGSVVEPERERGVVYDVDVAVAGGGVAGVIPCDVVQVAFMKAVEKKLDSPSFLKSGRGEFAEEHDVGEKEFPNAFQCLDVTRQGSLQLFRCGLLDGD